MNTKAERNTATHNTTDVIDHRNVIGQFEVVPLDPDLAALRRSSQKQDEEEGRKEDCK